MAGTQASVRASAVVRLADGLHRRRGLMGGAAQEGLDRQLLLSLSRLRRTAVSSFATATDKAVDAVTATPMALALAAQMHLRFVLPGASREDLEGSGFSREVQRDALGLKLWLIDELTETIDRRATQHLVDLRAVRWMVDHHSGDNGRALAERLYRDATGAAPTGTVARGARLYALREGRVIPSIHALFLPWLDEGEAERQAAFDGRYADAALREGLARALGVDDNTVIGVLDRVVGTLTSRDHLTSLDRDQWRSSGAATLTGLAPSERAGHALIEPIGLLALDTDEWLGADDGRVRLGEVELAFERLAMQRVAAMSRLVHTALVARLWCGERHALDSSDLALFDMRHNVQTVLRPLIDWAGNDSVAEALSVKYDVEPPVMMAALKRVQQRWTARLARWIELPTHSNAWTPVGRLLDQAVRFFAVLDSLLSRPPLDEPHARPMLLFTAHCLAESNDLAFMPFDPDAPGIPEQLGTDLWGAWRSLINQRTRADHLAEAQSPE